MGRDRKEVSRLVFIFRVVGSYGGFFVEGMGGFYWYRGETGRLGDV